VKRNRGSILVLVLWTFSLLAAFSAALGFGVRQKAALLDRLDTLMSLRFMSSSDVEYARGVLKALDKPEDAYRALNEPWATDYGMTDEERKINLNKADAPTLSRLLQEAAGLSESDAQAIAYALVDWRDSDSSYSSAGDGAEDSDYAEFPLPYEAKDAPYEVLEEMLLVKGMTRELFDKLKEFVTLYGSGAVNINTAPHEVLTAIGLSRGVVDKIIHFRSGPDAKPGTGDDGIFAQIENVTAVLNKAVPPLDANEKVEIENMISKGKLTTSSVYFRIHSVGVLDKNKASMEIEAVVDHTGKIVSSRSCGVQWRS